MDDLISRQAAIEAVQNRRMMLTKEKVLLINDLEKLPPAAPQHKVRFSDADHVWIDGKQYISLQRFGEAVKDAREIILCKECNFWTKQKDSLQGRCALMGTYPTGNWFCGNAERRTE